MDLKFYNVVFRVFTKMLGDVAKTIKYYAFRITLYIDLRN